MGVLQDFLKFDRKAPVKESIFNNIAGLKACNFVSKRLLYKCFPVKFEGFFRTHIFKNVALYYNEEVKSCINV